MSASHSLRHRLNYAKRSVTKIVFYPFSALPACQLKDAARRTILRLQNSLPLELAVGKGDVVLQIGTPWPRTMKRLRKAAGNSGVVVIVEAEPRNFDRLTDARDKAGFDNVHIVNSAAWSQDEDGVLNVSAAFAGDHKIGVEGVLMDNDLRPENAEMKVIPCKFRKIDTILADLHIETLDYLSITVNGAELEVLKGATKTLNASPRVRVYSKGHSLQNDKTPLNQPIRAFLESLCFKTMLTRGEPTPENDSDWLWRAGDVYAWKPLSRLSLSR